MKILAFPADRFGCGSHRILWPCAALRAQGADVTVADNGEGIDAAYDRYSGVLLQAKVPEADVVVFQRPTDRDASQLVPYLRERGVSVVVDVDDDLSAVHPANPAWTGLNNGGRTHWRNLRDACKAASWVTVTTPALLRKYAPHGRGSIVPNCAPDHYLDVPHEDSDLVGWPASLATHPTDPTVVGSAVARFVQDGGRFEVVGPVEGVGRAFGLPFDPAGGRVVLDDWPGALSRLGVGIAPLAPTVFSRAKSPLKPIELSACGVPWIASPTEPYLAHRAVNAGGLIARSPKDWLRHLRYLTSDAGFRRELGGIGREWARANTVSKMAWRWAEAWESAVTMDRQAVEVAKG